MYNDNNTANEIQMNMERRIADGDSRDGTDGYGLR